MADPSKPEPTLSDWAPCPPGAFEQLTEQLRARRSRRFFLRAAAVAAGTAAVGTGWLLWRLNQEQPTNFGGIVCPDVVRLGPDYARNDLSQELREKIRIHISLCPNCGPYYRSKGWAT